MIFHIKTKSGEEFPIVFDQESMSWFVSENDISFNQVAEMGNFMDWPVRLFHKYLIACFEIACDDRGRKFPYMDRKAFNKWLVSDQSIMEQCMKYWVESQPKADPSDSPKKQTQTARKGR